jgi:multiple sugar transport system ATP-binding protein
VALVERLGSETNVSVTLPSGASFLAVLEGDRAVTNGQDIGFAFDASEAILFDKAGIARYV